MSIKAPEELRKAVEKAVEFYVGSPARAFDCMEDALAAIEAKYGPDCWTKLERAKETDDFATRRMNE